jgi:hypothetical protein
MSKADRLYVASSPHSTSSQRCLFLLSPELVHGGYRAVGKEGIRRTAERGCCSADPEIRATASGRAVVQEAAACGHRVASGSERDECPKAGQGAQTRKGSHDHSGACLVNPTLNIDQPRKRFRNLKAMRLCCGPLESGL